ncbi:MAG: 3-oxoacyl-ACP reductase FabG [Thermonemataceae bacterium]
MKIFDNKVAVVTGAAQGIGKAIAQRLAEQGALVVIWDVQTEKAEETVKAFKTQGWRASAFTDIDITDLVSTEQVARQVIEAYGQVDILVNNAGIIQDATLKKMSAKTWQQVIDVNLTGVFNCTRAVVPHMIERKSGNIISISSVVGLFGNFGQTNYVAAKAGVAAMTKTWALELGKYQIRVNAIAPGAIDTAMLAGIPEEAKAKFLERIPLGRVGKPQDIANACSFLASEEASFITGQTLVVDGGNYLG